MSIHRLTQRARNVLQNVAETDEVTVGQLLEEIESSAGMGTLLLKGFPKLKVKKKRVVDLNKLVKEAFFQSIKFQHNYVGTEHLLMALLTISASADANKIKAELLRLNIFPNNNKSFDFTKTAPTLSAFGENITYKFYKSTSELVFRDELDVLTSTLLQLEKPNPLIVGDTGVGKRTLAKLLTLKINSLDVPPVLAGYQIVEFDLMGFIASTFNKGGSIETSLVNLLQEIAGVGRVILFIKNFQNIFVATNAGVAIPMVYSLFKSGLNSAGIRIIATMDTALYDKIVTENESVLENFSVVHIDEPSEEETMRILESQAEVLSMYHNVAISKKVIKYAYDKASEEITDIKFPKKGLDLLDQACTKVIIRENKIPLDYKNIVDKTFKIADEIDTTIEGGDYAQALLLREELYTLEDKLMSNEERMFNSKRISLATIDIDKALADLGNFKEDEEVDLDNLTNLAGKIKKSIIGQDKAVDIIVKSLVRSKLGLRAKKRPLGNFLFLGPTGVGKTELAKVMAEGAFGTNSLIRLDMSDFSEKHTIARLIGAPPGYVGYGEGGELTSKIELRPSSVVLFDEIEKAHPDVLNILLQIMEEGELTDAKGTTFDFSGAVIVLTSNLGTEILHKAGIGFDDALENEDNVEDRLLRNLRKILKPELINRFDATVVFRRLSPTSQLKVLDLLVEEVKNTLKGQKVTLSVGIKSKRYLLDKGYSKEFGARSLRRTVETELLDRIAEVLLKHKERPLKLKASVENGVFKVESLT